MTCKAEREINDHQNSLVKTARMTGLWYLCLAISGIFGFLVFHPQIYVTNEPAETLRNLTEKESLARIRLLLEFAVIIAQALTAVWFYRLFRKINGWGGWTLGIWGTMNSGLIMISAISMATALKIANTADLSFEQQVVLIQLLQSLGGNAWGVGSLFFGLWLIPMGYIVVSSERMPVWMGRILIIGGAGYLLNTFLNYMGLGHALVDALVIPATVGEFWMIGYLLIYGIRASNGQFENIPER
ncbi:DUF4386 domain-containing protein [Litoribacter populi]|uniref:DUF4386 domain-containing protein n=1 Tax=Litoribacter populi TaxID=2598460 RepID=UPI00117F6795|nr:DUF4386 domain-containing protein [Litoribacter populi]